MELDRKSVVESSILGDARMGPAYFVIAILGCADGGTSCTPVATLQTHYTSEAQCVAATGAALIDNSDFDYPTLVARCHGGEQKTAEEQKPGTEKRRRG
jgi:acyl-CoA synthetase (AMP-forming)/AMP-acid ligase II